MKQKKPISSVWMTMHDQAEADHVVEAIGSLHNESDRSAAIVAATIVEYSLAAALKRFMHNDEKITDELFRTTGPLGSFATKIHVGFLIGLYGKEAHRDLTTMKDVRNSFAHRLSVKSFESQKIKALCMNLKLVERHTTDACSPDQPRADTWQIGLVNRDEHIRDPRERYLMSAQIMTHGLAISHQCGMPRPFF